MLAPMQQKFVEEYLLDLNATQAAIRAGYGAKSAFAAASRMLKNVKIAYAIREGLQARALRTEVKADDVIRELLIVAKSDIGQIIDFSGKKPKLRPANEITLAARLAISSMKVRHVVKGKGAESKTVEIIEFKLWPKTDAQVALGRHLGMFIDRHEHSGSVNLEVVETIVRTREEARSLPPLSAAEPIPGRNGAH